MKRFLAACEVSGATRDAFARAGYDAWSADILPARGQHIICDHTLHLADIVYDRRRRWDIMLAFPPCTYLSVSGLHWNSRARGHERTEEALEFVRMLLNAPIAKIGLENPVGCISTRLGQLVTGGPWQVKPHTGKATCPPSQIIQPYEFGENASKKTCLWLKGLPLLLPTRFVAPRVVDGKRRWANQTDSGQNKLGPSSERAAVRAITYRGIAEAMASQWA